MSRTALIPLVVLAPLAILPFLMPVAHAQGPVDAQGDENALEQFRDDLQATETQIIARTVSLATE